MLKRAITGFIIIGLVFSIFGAVLPAQGGIIDDLKREIAVRQDKSRELAQKKKETQNTIANLEKQERSLANQIALLESQIAELSLEIAIAENQIEETQLEIDRLSAEIAQREKEIERIRLRIANLIQELYEQGDKNLVEIVFGADDFSDVFDELRSFEVLEAGLADLLHNLKTHRERLLEEKTSRETQKTQLEEEQAELTAKHGVLENQQDQKEYLLRSTRKEEASYEKLLKSIEEQAKDVQLEILEIESKLRFAVDRATLPKGKGILSWPTVSSRITQGYGATSQTGFINDAYKFHNGIDIGAVSPGVSGDPIYAAASGTIVDTGNSDRYCRGAAYGKWITLDHENGLTTMYAHLATIVVSSGQRVERGNVIGYMDSTGFSTGAHLHFTVYASLAFFIKDSNNCGPLPFGDHINPLEYL